MFQRVHDKQYATVFAIVFLCATAFLLLNHFIGYPSHSTITSPFAFSQDGPRAADADILGPTDSAKHPIEILVEEANEKFQVMQQQSTTFEEAVTEYKR